MPRRLTTGLICLVLVTAACTPTVARRPVSLAASAPTTVPRHPIGTQYDQQATQTFLVDREPGSWNPHLESRDPQTAATLEEILGPVLPSVFDVQPGYQVALNSVFVQSAVQISADPQTIRYQINPRAVWSDGTPITYADFVYNWQQQSLLPLDRPAGGAPTIPPPGSGDYRQVASVSEVGGDPYRVSVVMSTPDLDWRSLFSMMLPAHIGTAVDFATGFTDPVTDLSGGPFEVQSYLAGVSVTLVRNPRYWGPPANLAQVEYRFVPSAARILPSFVRMQVGAGSPTPSPALVAGLAQVAGLQVSLVPGPEWEHLDFNQATPTLSDVMLRRAIMMAIDRPALMGATIGRVDPALRPLDNLVFVAGQAGYRNDATTLPGAVVGARLLLEQAGYTLTGGILSHGGQPVTLRITSNAGDPMRNAEERFVITALAGIGITVTEHDTANLTLTLAGGDFDLALLSSTASPYLSRAAERYQTNDMAGVGAANFDHSGDPATDALILRAEAVARPKARILAFDALDAQLWADAVSLPLFQDPVLLVHATRYANMMANPGPGGPTWNIGQWGVPVSP